MHAPNERVSPLVLVESSPRPYGRNVFLPHVEVLPVSLELAVYGV